MNAFVKKEIRLLLPNAAICCALGLGNFFFTFDNNGSLQYLWGFLLSFVFCGGLAVMLALSSFGVEISAGTFSNLLAQPVPRQKIWDTKILLLAGALSAVAIFWGGCGVIRLAMLGRNLGLLDVFTGLGIFGLAIFSGGLWTVLLLRQVAAAFWFTVLVPAFLLVIFSGLFEDEHLTAGILACVFGIYSLGGFLFARRLFFRAQDAQWSGGVIVMPEVRGRARLKSALAGTLRQWRPHAALFWKEVQLHQAQFIFAGALLVLHLGALAARAFGNFRKNSSTEFILEMFWGLWLVLPLLVGAAAVAEERKLGTLAAQLCLPVRRRTQFALKFRVMLMLSVLFGAIIPVLLEGRRILPAIHFLPPGMEGYANQLAQTGTLAGFFWFGLWTLNILTPLLLLIGLALAIGAIAFYASSLARNTLQALAPAVAGLALFLFLVFTAAMPPPMFRFIFGSVTGGFHLWHGTLIYFTGIPAFFVTLTALAFWNSRQPAPGFAAIRRNAISFAAVFVAIILATSAIYNRAWEKLTPFEPPHGAAKLSGGNPPALENYLNYFTVRLADGRIWANSFGLNMNSKSPLAFFSGNIRLESWSQNNFYTGSNWVSLYRNWQGELAGLKTDSTLWISSKPARFTWQGGDHWDVSKPGDLVHFGNETNWSSLQWHGYSLLLTKTDGTLWRLGWGEKDWNRKNFNWKKWPGLHAFTPEQIGTRTNWTEVFSLRDRGYLRKTDGSVWSLWADTYYKWPIEELEPGFQIQRQPFLETTGERSTTEIWSGMRYGLAVRNDGTFRISADQQLNHKTHSYETVPANYQFGHETNWLAVAGRGEKVVTLKNDGTLWLWDFSHDNRRGWNLQIDEREMLSRVPTRLGAHADWLAIAEAPGGIVSLAADGSLWYWPLDSAARFAGNFGGSDFWDNDSHSQFEPLLDIARKPQRLGNIFSRAE